MAIVIPIKGLRYNPALISNLKEVVTPPYDVIDAAAQEKYYKCSPYNIIRLEYGKDLPGDNESCNRYTRAAADFKSWLESRVLTPESSPALYLYEQEFTIGGERKVRSGFICGVKLEPYEKGVILPHEETMPKHKADRLKLMRACRANFSPIFSLYEDREKRVETVLREAVEGTAPDVDFTDEWGESHRLWVITSGEVINKVQQAMAGKRIFIADGHHRYETALNFKREQAARETEASGFTAESVAVTSSCSVTPENAGSCARTEDHAYNYVMMTLVNLYDPGLVVLPTHRLVKNIREIDLPELVDRLKESFLVEEFPLAPDRSNFQEFLQDLAERGKVRPDQASGSGPGGRDTVNPHRSHAFGMYAGDNRLYLLTHLNNRQLDQVMPPGKSRAWQNLDVSVLHTLIIEKHLGICGELRARAEHITYTREEEGALAAVDSGAYQLAFFLNPTPVEEVIEVAGNGEKMPQKSTFFYPKLITGLVVNRL
ncbi:MAG: DUF1015 domain-containing protein [Peptococcaceae bacterium MAG4]|jgi:uncharacterized protein (DUF1015 family)|nr:DUF1015 domain-containing protein [Peptococcaceae bacterium MAG4]NLW39126.1 DUF1015 domain-containing protein [Peptococcaceae bacterium]